MKKQIVLLIAGLLVTANVLGQNRMLPYLYLKDTIGNIREVPFTDGTISIMDNLILVNTPKDHYEYNYDAVEKFYFKDKSHLTLADLIVSEGVLTPEFSGTVLSYTVCRCTVQHNVSNHNGNGK